ncbi:hypothetical protein L2E82_02398 [Cichorium intybus]|uniref:Uncharacterized protein n=1 Tax=Cichorium intybus TaxID=13427 RepID=A0ACB9H2B7_CICIN|nr:hypothetical protein L2E82_02398 [Cichorium intybus]
MRILDLFIWLDERHLMGLKKKVLEVVVMTTLWVVSTPRLRCVNCGNEVITDRTAISIFPFSMRVSDFKHK